MPRLSADYYLIIIGGMLALVVPVFCSAEIVINELLADPNGSDAGCEFVELMNNGSEVESLAELELQFANGAHGAIWSTRWTGSLEELLQPGQRYLIVDRNWLAEIPFQAEVWLGLQNGPDAIRLSRNADTVDLVGYGALTDPELMEQQPAGLRPGESLARRPDGYDSDNNYLDFFSAEPTPGLANFNTYELKVVARELEPPVCNTPETDLLVTLTLVNTGIELIPSGEIRLLVAGSPYRSFWDECLPGHQRTIVWQVQPAAWGLSQLKIELPVVGTTEVVVLAVGKVQVGPENLVISEVLGAPTQDQGEWFELAVYGTELVNLANYRVRDEDGSWKNLPAIELAPDEFLVVAEDSLALVRWHTDNIAHGVAADCLSDRQDNWLVELSGAWPNLNNSPPDDRNFADRVWLERVNGTVIDCVTLCTAGISGQAPIPTGISLERIASRQNSAGNSNWTVCTDQKGSTPGCPNSVAATAETSINLTVTPRYLDATAGVSTLHIQFSLTDSEYGWESRIYDLWGGVVRELGGDVLGPGQRDVLWNGCDDSGEQVELGAYVVLVKTRNQAGNQVSVEKVLAIVRGQVTQ